MLATRQGSKLTANVASKQKCIVKMNIYVNEVFVKGEWESHMVGKHTRGRKFRFDAIDCNKMFIY